MAFSETRSNLLLLKVFLFVFYRVIMKEKLALTVHWDSVGKWLRVPSDLDESDVQKACIYSKRHNAYFVPLDKASCFLRTVLDDKDFSIEKDAHLDYVFEGPVSTLQFVK